MAVCLSRQFSSVFINNNSRVNLPTSVHFSFIARPTPTIKQFSNYPISPNDVRIFLCLLPNKYNNSPPK